VSVPPALILRFALEEAPDITIDALNDGELVRLCDWIDAHPTFLRLIAALYALVEQERA
jgi:hypothetical protein